MRWIFSRLLGYPTAFFVLRPEFVILINDANFTEKTQFSGHTFDQFRQHERLDDQAYFSRKSLKESARLKKLRFPSTKKRRQITHLISISLQGTPSFNNLSLLSCKKLRSGDPPMRFNWLCSIGQASINSKCPTQKILSSALHLEIGTKFRNIVENLKGVG